MIITLQTLRYSSAGNFFVLPIETSRFVEYVLRKMLCLVLRKSMQNLTPVITF